VKLLSKPHKPKHRRQNAKREHHLLQALAPVLEKVADHPAVQSVIPARIKSAVRGSGVELEPKYKTQTGLKLLAKSNGGVQEIFVVTNEAEAVKAFILNRGYDSK
jgi:hypothetical protein